MHTTTNCDDVEPKTMSQTVQSHDIYDNLTTNPRTFGTHTEPIATEMAEENADGGTLPDQLPEPQPPIL